MTIAEAFSIVKASPIMPMSQGDSVFAKCMLQVMGERRSMSKMQARIALLESLMAVSRVRSAKPVPFIPLTTIRRYQWKHHSSHGHVKHAFTRSRSFWRPVW